ncbi:MULTISPECIES: DUF2975 domain-containing protein [Brevibacterium]|nr:DUF2975 domain-containing protein [Brevibacterium casei]NJE67529.1 DUF2975 domain-containing protein [Brevibacterium sp. LS14]SIJ08893.1 Uncharacterised protein [Mycobacteroides abscessus subsp. abscessus]MBE4694279.1 DUF2975 domain-containing protein [Brevibacterium casei]MBY3577402.1 DUF2975 domain-containing protein [Brevibacterium casei]MCT1448442.1 DUF2975 domain-containing protein [Brevibacterium casei]
MGETNGMPVEMTKSSEGKSRSGMESVISGVLGVYGVYLAYILVKGLIANEIGIRFEFADDASAAIDVGGSAVALSGPADVTVSTVLLAPETMVLLIISKLTVIIGLIGAAIICFPILRDIAHGTPFTSRALKALSVLALSVAILVIIYAIAATLGSNLASRDLGISDSVSGGLGVTQVFLFLGIAGGIALLQRSFASGRKAQEELEGLV